MKRLDWITHILAKLQMIGQQIATVESFDDPPSAGRPEKKN
jgi:hypothetical protein